MENNNRSGNGRRPSEDRREYGNRRPRIGESRYSGERRDFGERRSFGENSGSDSGERTRRPRIGDRNNSGETRNYGERRSYGDRNSEGRSFGERRSYGENRYSGERRSYGDRNNEGRSFGDRKPYGERRSYGDRNNEGRGFGDRKPYGERRSYGDRNNEGRGFGDRKPFNSNGRKPFNRNNNRYHDSDESGINKMIDRKQQQDIEAFSDNDHVSIPVKSEVRLNKFISNSGICSRREADNFIQAGVVTVNGEIVTELGTKININTDEVKFNGERLKGEEKVYIVMNKPKGFVTTTSDPHAEKTVMDLLKGCESRVFSVGRLDKNTTGVLMFTNDGEIAEKLTHPSYNKKKIYQVSLDKKLTQEDYDKIVAGILLNDGEIKADELEYIDENDHRKLGIEIHSGKNRIVRRIFESLGYEVKALDRVYFAGLTKKNLKKGQWRYLSEGEVNILKMGAYL